jgi:hypothetical protein
MFQRKLKLTKTVWFSGRKLIHKNLEELFGKDNDGTLFGEEHLKSLVLTN